MSDIATEKEEHTSLREMLAQHDRRVRAAFADVADSTTGTTRVQALHAMSRMLSAHDSVVGSTLCPLLEKLPGGHDVAGNLLQGCERRASLLARFQSLSQGTAARNVYPVFGAEVEAILGDLERSFEQHVHDETTRVGELLESAARSVEPDVVAARMAIDAGRAPARAHPMIYRHPGSRALRALYRSIDRVHEWNDSHHGWPSARLPRRTVAIRPARRFTRSPLSIPELLSDYDHTVDALIAEWAEPDQRPTRRAQAAYRLAAAIAIHDSIVAATLCPLLEAAPEGRPAAAVLRKGCGERAGLLEEWGGLVAHASPSDLFVTRVPEATRVVEQLITSFRAHETRETTEVSAVVQQMRGRSWKAGGTGLVSPYLHVEWPNPEPAALAAHMATWAEKAPTHSHALLSRHPANRLLRNFYRRADRLRDRRYARNGWPTLS